MEKPTLEEVLEYIDSIPFINSGGCGIAALSIYRWLKNKGETASFIFFYDDHDIPDISTNRAKIEKGERNLCVPAHIAVVYNNNTIDSHGINRCDSCHYIATDLLIDEAFIVETINNPADEWGWNKMFDRKYTKSIQEKIQIDLSDIKIGV